MHKSWKWKWKFFALLRMSEDVYHLKDYESEGKDKPVGTIDMSDYILLQHFESLVTS